MVNMSFDVLQFNNNINMMLCILLIAYANAESYMHIFA